MELANSAAQNLSLNMSNVPKDKIADMFKLKAYADKWSKFAAQNVIDKGGTEEEAKKAFLLRQKEIWDIFKKNPKVHGTIDNSAKGFLTYFTNNFADKDGIKLSDNLTHAAEEKYEHIINGKISNFLLTNATKAKDLDEFKKLTGGVLNSLKSDQLKEVFNSIHNQETIPTNVTSILNSNENKEIFSKLKQIATDTLTKNPEELKTLRGQIKDALKDKYDEIVNKVQNTTDIKNIPNFNIYIKEINPKLYELLNNDGKGDATSLSQITDALKLTTKEVIDKKPVGWWESICNWFTNNGEATNGEILLKGGLTAAAVAGVGALVYRLAAGFGFGSSSQEASLSNIVKSMDKHGGSIALGVVVGAACLGSLWAFLKWRKNKQKKFSKPELEYILKLNRLKMEDLTPEQRQKIISAY